MTKALTKKFDGDSETLATVAARCRNPKVMTILHEAGVDLNQVNFSGISMSSPEQNCRTAVYAYNHFFRKGSAALDEFRG